MDTIVTILVIVAGIAVFFVIFKVVGRMHLNRAARILRRNAEKEVAVQAAGIEDEDKVDYIKYQVYSSMIARVDDRATKRMMTELIKSLPEGYFRNAYHKNSLERELGVK